MIFKFMLGGLATKESSLISGAVHPLVINDTLHNLFNTRRTADHRYENDCKFLLCPSRQSGQMAKTHVEDKSSGEKKIFSFANSRRKILSGSFTGIVIWIVNTRMRRQKLVNFQTMSGENQPLAAMTDNQFIS